MVAGMFGKRYESEGARSATGGAERRIEETEGRMSATGGTGMPPSGVGAGERTGRVEATGPSVMTPESSEYQRTARTGAGWGTERESTEGRLERATERIERAADRIGTRMEMAGEETKERIAEIRDVTSEKMGEAGEKMREVARQVDIEEFRLRGNVAGQPFLVDMGSEEGQRQLVFEVNVRTEDGDTVRISGRKNLSTGGPMSGSVTSGQLGEGTGREGMGLEGGEYGRTGLGREEGMGYGREERGELGRGERKEESRWTGRNP